MKNIFNKLKENRRIGKEMTDRMKEMYRLEMKEGVKPTFDDLNDEKNYRMMKGVWNINKFQFKNVKFIFIFLLTALVSVGMNGITISLLNLPLLSIFILFITLLLSIYILFNQKKIVNNPTNYFLASSAFTTMGFLGFISYYTNLISPTIIELVFIIIILLSFACFIYSIFMDLNFKQRMLEEKKDNNDK